MKVTIELARTDQAIAHCYPAMHELRTHLTTANEFVERVRKQEAEGYRLAYLEMDDQVRAVAGYRYMNNLFSGRLLYVDDLVTLAGDRSLGFGGLLFDWLVAQAREQKCDAFELDSGVQRFAAHRFYLRKRMEIESHHFRLRL
jgi:GNAT superfamily N-acetyltransferase